MSEKLDKFIAKIEADLESNESPATLYKKLVALRAENERLKEAERVGTRGPGILSLRNENDALRAKLALAVGRLRGLAQSSLYDDEARWAEGVLKELEG